MGPKVNITRCTGGQYGKKCIAADHRWRLDAGKRNTKKMWYCNRFKNWCCLEVARCKGLE